MYKLYLTHAVDQVQALDKVPTEHAATSLFHRYCKNFSFLVKVDDDVFLQLDKLERMLRAIRDHP